MDSNDHKPNGKRPVNVLAVKKDMSGAKTRISSKPTAYPSVKDAEHLLMLFRQNLFRNGGCMTFHRHTSLLPGITLKQ
jgi:hypothetical protein